MKLRLQGQDAKTIAEIAAHLPVRALHPASQDLLLGTPGLRREFLDWGLFHVERSFYSAWKRYHRTLEQTNEALKGGHSALGEWRKILAEEGTIVTALRQAYVTELVPYIQQQVARLMNGGVLDIQYRQGWPECEPLVEALSRASATDARRGFISNGPHRADLEIIWNSKAASKVGSRGQLKLIVSALTIAQLHHFRSRTGRGTVLLLDELPAELDGEARALLLAALKDLEVQVFVTAIDPALIELEGWASEKRFHVEQGRIRELL